MKKLITILAGGILGMSMMMAGMNQAEARPNRNYRSSKRVASTTYHQTKTKQSWTRTKHQMLPHKKPAMRPGIRIAHKAKRFHMKKVYALRHLRLAARRLLNLRYRGNVQLFCTNNPGYCSVSYTKVWY